MAHDIEIDVPAQTVFNKDITIKVSVDGAFIGRLKISKGSVDWVPKGHSANAFRLSWQRFAMLMESQKPTRIKT